jgi:hypothetical protein
MITNNISINDNLNDSYESPFGFTYRGYVFVFDTKEERDLWVEECDESDLDYIIDEQEETTEV